MKLFIFVGESIFNRYIKNINSHYSQRNTQNISSEIAFVKSKPYRAHDYFNKEISYHLGIISDVIKDFWMKVPDSFDDMDNITKVNDNCSIEIEVILKDAKHITADNEVVLVSVDTPLSVLAADLIVHFFQKFHKGIKIQYLKPEPSLNSKIGTKNLILLNQHNFDTHIMFNERVCRWMECFLKDDCCIGDLSSAPKPLIYSLMLNMQGRYEPMRSCISNEEGWV